MFSPWGNRPFPPKSSLEKMVTYLPRHVSLPSHPLQRILLPGPTQPPRKTRRVSSPKVVRNGLFQRYWLLDINPFSVAYGAVLTRAEGPSFTTLSFVIKHARRGNSNSSERGRHIAFLNFRCISYFDPLNLKWEIGPKPPSSELSGFEAFHNFRSEVICASQAALNVGETLQ